MQRITIKVVQCVTNSVRQRRSGRLFIPLQCNTERMERTERLQTSVTPDEKQQFQHIAIDRGYSHTSELVRELVYDTLEEEGYPTSREQ